MNVDKEVIIQKTVQALNVLPKEKAEEVSEFAEFLLKKYEEQILRKGTSLLQATGNAFNFLNEDEELYTTADIKE